MSFAVKDAKLHQEGTEVDFIRSPYTGGKFRNIPKIVVMHFTFGASARSSADWFRSPDNPGSSAHVVIDRDGQCYQCVDLNTVAWHAGRSRLGDLVGLNNYSIGIELANWGYLKQSGSKWFCHANRHIEDVFIGTHKNGNPDGVSSPIGWERYTEVQFNTAAKVAAALVKAYGITQIVGHDDISKGRKWDPGPAFDMSRFKARVFGERASEGDSRMAVDATEGLNMRRGPGISFDVVQLLPHGTQVDVLEKSAKWALVSVLSTGGNPTMTGWVYSDYLDDI